jgi:hypothetical protein
MENNTKKINYASATQNTVTRTKEKPLSSLNEYINNGYTLIKENPITKKTEITYAKNYFLKKQEMEEKNYKKKINAMINNWNNYRDEVNEILGDRSPYCDYKEILNKMIEEDNYIMEELYKRKHNICSDYDSDYNSDYEEN